MTPRKSLHHAGFKRHKLAADLANFKNRHRVESNKLVSLFNRYLASDDTVATTLGLVAEIERDFISSRTKEALAKRKAEGMKLGRPEGPAKKLRLDAHAKQIDDYMAKGIDKRAIAKLLDVSPNTLYAWLKVRRAE